tara:strand:- start:338 stop:709 length:372 start_codon:yes stop_codon:yes gene_type:complete
MWAGGKVADAFEEGDAAEVQRAGEKVRNSNRGEREDAERKISELDSQRVVNNQNDFSNRSTNTDARVQNFHFGGGGDSLMSKNDVDNIVNESGSLDELVARVNNLESVVDTTSLNQQPPSRMS